MCEHGNIHVLHRSVWPAWIQDYRNGDRMSIDSCIVDLVRELWRRDVRTLGSCCGHGQQQPISFVLDGHGAAADHAREQLDQIGWPEPVTLKQWRLVDVTRNGTVTL